MPRVLTVTGALLLGASLATLAALEQGSTNPPRSSAVPQANALTGAQSPAMPDPFLDGVHRLDEPRLVKPKALRQIMPRYTHEAMRQKIQGIVDVEAVVLPDGTVGRDRVAKSLDTEYGLDQSALDAALKWTFEPARLDGVAVPALVHLILEFRLH
jgi:TonB family protein